MHDDVQYKKMWEDRTGPLLLNDLILKMVPDGKPAQAEIQMCAMLILFQREGDKKNLREPVCK